MVGNSRRVKFEEVREAFKRIAAADPLVDFRDADTDRDGDLYDFVVTVCAANIPGHAELKAGSDSADLMIVHSHGSTLQPINMVLGEPVRWHEFDFEIADVYAQSLIEHARHAIRGGRASP